MEQEALQMERSVGPATLDMSQEVEGYQLLYV